MPSAGEWADEQQRSGVGPRREARRSTEGGVRPRALCQGPTPAAATQHPARSLTQRLAGLHAALGQVDALPQRALRVLGCGLGGIVPCGSCTIDSSRWNPTGDCGGWPGEALEASAVLEASPAGSDPEPAGLVPRLTPACPRRQARSPPHPPTVGQQRAQLQGHGVEGGGVLALVAAARQAQGDLLPGLLIDGGRHPGGRDGVMAWAAR